MFIIPKVKAIDTKHGIFAHPDFLRFKFNERVALVIVLISGISYLGFTSGQLLAGGTFTLVALIKGFEMLYGLDASFYGILLSGAEFISLSLLFSDREKLEAPEEAVL
ncbi:MAG TPA: hypothetical protein PLZ21_11930 [Armatimonadota bacterium]|nr:hypothetical protein [Armatimonadota bacterium]